MLAWLPVAKVVFLIQMFLTFGGRYNRYFWDTRLKMLRLVNFNMLFELVLTKFSKVNCFRVYRKLVTWSSHAKSLYEVTESTLRVLYMTYLSASLRNQNGVLPNLRVVSLKAMRAGHPKIFYTYIGFLFGVMTRAEHFKTLSFYWSWRKNPHASWWKSPD